MFNFKFNRTTKQTIAEARSAYDVNQSKANKKADTKRRKLFDKFFKKIAQSMKKYGHYILRLEEIKELNNGWVPFGLDVKDEDKDRVLRNAFDEKLELEALKDEYGFYTGQFRQFLLEAREAGLVIKHNWSKSKTFTGWYVDSLVFTFPRDKK